MLNHSLISLVNSVLGTGKPTSRGNYAYVCPFHTSNPPGKKNFEINFTSNDKGENAWHCWGCSRKGKKIYQIFNALKVNSEKINELKSIVTSYNSEDFKYINKADEQISLPKEFKSLLNLKSTDITGKHAINYLKNRNIIEEDIIKYNLGYCDSGGYYNRIIIPSYNNKGEINYFTGRSFEKDPFLRYKNPSHTRNIIPFDLFINWDLPITLCEGAIDAISIKRNAIPLLGKNIQSSLMKKIIESKMEKIYIALDKDAQKEALNSCQNFMSEGKEVYLVDMKDKDPNKLGFENFTKLIQNTYPLTFSSLLEKKISL